MGGKEDNKYKKYIKRSVGGWIAKILIDLFWLLIIFAFPIARMELNKYLKAQHE